MKKTQLTIYVKAADMHGDQALYEVLVQRLSHAEVAGATVFRGAMGYGRHGKMHRKRLFGVSDDQPMLIIAIDDEARLRHALHDIRPLIAERLITLQEVEVL